MTDLGLKNDEARDALIELVQRSARQLGEHCDTVHIFVTKELEGGGQERAYEFGTGSWLARIAQVREFCIIQDERAKIWARQQEEKED